MDSCLHNILYRYNGCKSFGSNPRCCGLLQLQDTHFRMVRCRSAGKALVGVDTNEVMYQMNDDLTRMVLNPDVTVRARGVIEKCSFCVQRLQDTKLEAKKQQDPTLVRNVKVACAQACPSNAISFGNVNDKQSDVYKIRNVEQVNRNFYVLEQLHVLPNVSYLAKVRNTDREVNNGNEREHENSNVSEGKKMEGNIEENKEVEAAH